ncbi:hypothetical protein PGT21_022537 [Puccinia graminis f. sp. tritici]|uniref:Uncharacterized protein n=1 Tax=Puccinia graminis f. sp. tritici TaxID=56615 RepID=A0A5B0NT19_PUCGR|nr:hypothetical protein PGT21_022537 [Puccinia graminis f. sp. tritici]KAA1092361.1 hypothetical protein PGTUg99_023091 [Puccinia graminis f. sp. tritici]
MAFSTEWIPGATFSGRADFPGETGLISAANPNLLSNVDTARSNDKGSIDNSSIASNDETNIARSDADPVIEATGSVKHARSASPPAYRLEALPLGSPENPIEIEDEEAANPPRNNEEISDYERLNSPRFDPVEIVPFQAMVVDEEDVLRARERIKRWFNNHIRHNSQQVLRGRSRRARAAAGPVEPYWTVNELMDSVLEELDDILNNASRVDLIHI